MPKEGTARILTDAELKRLLIIAKEGSFGIRNQALVYCSFSLGLRVIKQGDDIKAVSRLAGHASIVTSSAYVEDNPERLKRICHKNSHRFLTV